MQHLKQCCVTNADGNMRSLVLLEQTPARSGSQTRSYGLKVSLLTSLPRYHSWFFLARSTRRRGYKSHSGQNQNHCNVMTLSLSRLIGQLKQGLLVVIQRWCVQVGFLTKVEKFPAFLREDQDVDCLIAVRPQLFCKHCQPKT